MIKQLELNKVGPAPKLHIDFADRLNVITGDNGLGKSFILDCVWWAMTKKWPAQINKKNLSGNKALPGRPDEASISYTVDGKTKKGLSCTSTFDVYAQEWTSPKGRPLNPGLVLYAMVDGSFAVWDPARNYWKESAETTERPPAYVFSSQEVWNGMTISPDDDRWLCNGIIRDWASWQKEEGEAWQLLRGVLEEISPRGEIMRPGRLTRIDLDDARDMPTVIMPYGAEVPIVHLSSAMKRMIALSYCLVWAWMEHKAASEKVLHQPPTDSVTFLVDEIESHLHPQWQRQIVPSLLNTIERIRGDGKTDAQVIMTTHSPMVMVSMQDIFDESRDAWFDLDLENREVRLTQRAMKKYGDAEGWLTGPAFDMDSTRSPKVEQLIDEASMLLREETPNPKEFEAIHQKLLANLDPQDTFLCRWRYMATEKGLLP